MVNLYKVARSPQLISVLVVLVLLGFVFRVYFTSPVRDRGDSRYVLHVANSILKERNTDLDEYQWLIEKEGIYKTRILTQNGHLYSIYPLGTSLLALPFVALYDWWNTTFVSPISIDKQIILSQTDLIDNFLAALFVALAVLFVYLTGLQFAPWYLSLIGSLLLAFGTTAWTQAARTLWPHGPTMFVLALSLWLLIKASKNKAYAIVAALPLAFSFIIRPTNIIPLIFFTIYVFVKFPKVFIYYLLVTVVILAFYSFYNFGIYHAPLPPFYYPGGIRMGPYNHSLRFSPEGLAGQLVSPNRGLFIYSPVLLFAVIAMLILIKTKKTTLLDSLLMTTLFLHWILISSYQGWWAGWVFGPRYFTDVLPIFGYFLIIFLTQLSALRNKLLLSLCIFFLVMTGILSIWIQHAGATYWATSWWNGYPKDIDYFHERVWDWHDLQFLRRQ